MRRHLAWLGEPRLLSDLVAESPHSLVRRSHATRELLSGSVCADRFGIGRGSAPCVVMTDGRELVAACMAQDQLCDSPYVRRLPDGTLVASEPLDVATGREPLPADTVARVAPAFQTGARDAP